MLVASIPELKYCSFTHESSYAYLAFAIGHKYKEHRADGKRCPRLSPAHLAALGRVREQFDAHGGLDPMRADEHSTIGHDPVLEVQSDKSRGRAAVRE